MSSVRNQLLRFAYQKVSRHEHHNDSEAKATYGIWCHSLPALIRTSGLAGAYAFLLHKKGENGKALGFKWLLEDLQNIPGVDGIALLEKSKDGDKIDTVLTTTDYVILTRRTLQVLPYFKRFAVSILRVDENFAKDEAE